MLHKGIVCMVNPDLPMRLTKGELIKDGLLSLVYTGVLVFPVKAGLLKFLPDYFN